MKREELEEIGVGFRVSGVSGFRIRDSGFGFRACGGLGLFLDDCRQEIRVRDVCLDLDDDWRGDVVLVVVQQPAVWDVGSSLGVGLELRDQVWVWGWSLGIRFGCVVEV